jgi:NitT/TauT family transport system substrate-binding protein
MLQSGNRREFLGSLGATATAVGVAVSTRSLGIRSASADAPKKIVLGYLPLNALLPPYVGPIQPWAEEGLEVSFFLAGAGPAVLEALVTGKIPAGNVGIGPAISAASRGFPIQMLTMDSMEVRPNYPNTRIMVKKDSPIRSFQDLRGKKLAVHALGTMQHISLGAAFKRFGMSRDALTITTVPIPNQPQALEQGLVDAIYCAPPADAVAEHRFGARTVVETIDFIPYLAFSGIAMHREFAEQNPDAVKRLIKGAVRLQRWVDDNPDLGRKTSNKSLNIPDDISPYVRLPYFARNGLQSTPNVWHVYRMMEDARVIDPIENFPTLVEKYFIEPTQRFTLPAVEELGKQKDAILENVRQQQLPLLEKPVQEYLAPWERAS